MSEKKAYFKLGAGAASFHDPKSGLSLAGREVGEIDAVAAKSKTIRNAVTNGHLVEVDAEAYNKKGTLKATRHDELTDEARFDTGDGERDRDKNPNAFKRDTVSPSGAVSTTGGAVAPGGAGEEDDEDDSAGPSKEAQKAKRDMEKADKDNQKSAEKQAEKDRAEREKRRLEREKAEKKNRHR